MDPWEHIRRAAADTRNGSVAITARAARGLAGLTTKRDVARAARTLLKAHRAMGSLWRLAAAVHDADDIALTADRFREALQADADAAADGLRWAVGRRRVTVVTCSASGSVERALDRVATRVAGVRCMVSLPGGEGRPLAKRLERAGFETEVVPDAAVARACDDADLVLVGADAVTEEGVVNKIGTYPLALAAFEAGIGCYAIATTSKFVPASLGLDRDERFETTPLSMFDAVLTERGPRRSGAIKRAIARIDIPAPIARIGR